MLVSWGGVRKARCLRLNCAPPHSYAEVLTPIVTIIGDGAFGRGGHEGGALIGRLVAFWKAT